MIKTVLTFIFFAFLIFSCKKREIYNNYFINTSEDCVVAENDGIQKHISISSNCPFIVLNNSDWCIVSISKNCKDLYLKVLPNNSEEKRIARILLTYDKTSKCLLIEQSGKNSNNSLSWNTFPANSFSSIEYKLGSDRKNCLYKITSHSFFVNPNIKEQVFLGNIIKNKIDNISHLNTTNYKYNPITFVIDYGKIVKTITPSYELFNTFIEEHKKTIPKQNLEFNVITPISYTSYKHLHLLGVGNIGLNLDEVISGKSYLNNEMKSKTGVLYSFSQTFFSAIMDNPISLIKEDVSNQELSELSYISSINFGRTSFLVVESDYDFSLTNTIVNQIIKEKKIRESNIDIIGKFRFWLITLKQDGWHIKSGDFELVNEYVSLQSDYCVDDIVPLYFTINKLKNCSVNSFNIYLNLR